MKDGPTLASTSATVGPLLVEKLRAFDARLESVEQRVLASAVDDEAVHDLRVGLRRTRTVLEAGRRVLGRFHADEVRRTLREVQRATGALRDEEVIIGLVTSLGVGHPDVQAWLEARQRRERRLRSALLRRVRGGDLDRGRQLLGALLAFRVDPARDRRLAKFARRAVEKARREVERRRVARSDDTDALHCLRIAYKRLRYTCETFAEGLPSDLASLAQSAARFQGRLGDLHDVDMTVACVRRGRGLSDEARQALLAALAHEREERLAAYGKELGVVRKATLSVVRKDAQPGARKDAQLGARKDAPPLHAVGADSLRKTSTR
jgi:CHAD domain-containing protein